MMGKLTDEQQAKLAELEQLRDAPDDPGDDDVEWWEDGAGGRGARMRASRARTHGPDWLREHLRDKDAGQDQDQGGGDKPAQDPPAGTSGGTKRFQRRVG